MRWNSALHMGRVTTTVTAALVTALIGAGCEDCGGGGGGGDDGCVMDLLPGDLVLTEIMANPDGADEGKEWFEIFNAAAGELDLTGVKIITSRADATEEEVLTLERVTIAPGQYYVFGGMLDNVKPAYVDHAYGAELGGLRNNGGRFSIECDDKVVDRVIYVEMTDGVAMAFDGAQAPDAVANDDLLKWCAATTEYELDSFGTPGAANPSCGYVPPGQCDEGGGSYRPKVDPVVGDLVITEFMANPAGEDVGKEWIEIYVRADVDINGLQLGKVLGDVDVTLPEGDCLRVTAGSSLLFAQGTDPSLNGGLPTPDHLFDFSLLNSDGGLFVGIDDIVIDAITYTAVQSGASRALDPAHVDATENDGEAWWCTAEDNYGDGGLGTPGTANPSCGIVPPGQCEEPGAALRAKVAPQPGELIITEFMANPSGTDTGKEWIEVHATVDVDLNDLEIGRASGTIEHVVVEAACLRVSAGGYAVLAQTDDALLNGGLPGVDAVVDVTLLNTNSGIYLGHGGQLLDAVSYTTATASAATSLDPIYLDRVQNDDPASWCPAETSYGDGDLGSPGAANPSCGFVPAGQCYEGTTLRAKVEPVVGDLVITEFMANPDAVGDTAGEWFELYVGRDVDLNGLELGRASGTVMHTLAEGDCRRASADSYLLFAVNAASDSNGHLPPVDEEIPFGLTNSNTGLFVGLGGALLDQVTWTSSANGAATSLDPGARNPAANDAAASWCAATTPYGAGDLGTPAAANPACL